LFFVDLCAVHQLPGAPETLASTLGEARTPLDDIVSTPPDISGTERIWICPSGFSHHPRPAAASDSHITKFRLRINRANCIPRILSLGFINILAGPYRYYPGCPSAHNHILKPGRVSPWRRTTLTARSVGLNPAGNRLRIFRRGQRVLPIPQPANPKFSKRARGRTIRGRRNAGPETIRTPYSASRSIGATPSINTPSHRR